MQITPDIRHFLALQKITSTTMLEMQEETPQIIAEAPKFTSIDCLNALYTTFIAFISRIWKPENQRGAAVSEGTEAFYKKKVEPRLSSLSPTQLQQIEKALIALSKRWQHVPGGISERLLKKAHQISKMQQEEDETPKKIPKKPLPPKPAEPIKGKAQDKKVEQPKQPVAAEPVKPVDKPVQQQIAREAAEQAKAKKAEKKEQKPPVPQEPDAVDQGDLKRAYEIPSGLEGWSSWSEQVKIGKVSYKVLTRDTRDFSKPLVCCGASLAHEVITMDLSDPMSEILSLPQTVRERLKLRYQPSMEAVLRQVLDTLKQRFYQYHHLQHYQKFINDKKALSFSTLKHKENAKETQVLVYDMEDFLAHQVGIGRHQAFAACFILDKLTKATKKDVAVLSGAVQYRYDKVRGGIHAWAVFIPTDKSQGVWHIDPLRGVLENFAMEKGREQLEVYYGRDAIESEVVDHVGFVR